MFFARVDSRLVHGQIIEAWLPFLDARALVVANDELAEDELRQQIMSIAIPLGVDIHFSRVNAAAALLYGKDLAHKDALALFSSCRDACRAFDAGLAFTRLNLGNLHYGPGKKQICQHIALGKEDEDCLEHLRGKGVVLDYRCIPNDPVELA